MDDLIIVQSENHHVAQVKIDGIPGFCVLCGKRAGELFWNGRYMAHISCTKDAKAAKRHDIPLEEFTGKSSVVLRDHIPGPEKVLVLKEMVRRHNNNLLRQQARRAK